MKKIFFLFLGFIVCGALLPAQTLEEALLGAAVSISRELPANATVAVIHVRSDSEKLNDYVMQELYGAILRNRQIMPVKPDQGQLQNIRNELGSSTAGAITGETAQRIGRLLGVQYLITGAIERNGAEYRILFTAIDTNAQIKSQYSATVNPQNDPQLALLLGESFGSTENAPAADSAPRKTRQRIVQAANSRNNWISGELNFLPVGGCGSLGLGLGIGTRYERMLGSKISLGANIYWNTSLFDPPPLDGNTLEIDVSFRFYPRGKTFFLGAALGFHYYTYTYTHTDTDTEPGPGGHTYTYTETNTYTGTGIGAAVTPEIGWKIDVGKPGGLYIQPGIAGTFVFGEGYKEQVTEYTTEKRSYSGLITIISKVYFGMGCAF